MIRRLIRWREARRFALVEMLADELEMCGHDIVAFDVLDALSSAGLVVRRGRWATRLYYRFVMPQVPLYED